MVWCKCKICGRFFESQHAGSLSYCSQGCVDRYVEYQQYVEAMRRQKRLEAKARVERTYNDMVRGGSDLGCKFTFRKAKKFF